MSECRHRKKRRLIVAPNIHTGGGLVLLKSLLKCSGSLDDSILILDSRAQKELSFYVGTRDVFWTPCGILGRIKAELFARKRENECTNIFCFHNLPTFFTKKKVSVFLQNRLLVEQSSLSDFSLRPWVRIALERLILKTLFKKIAQFLVQTESMKSTIDNWVNSEGLNQKCSIKITPFVPEIDENDHADSNLPDSTDSDFIYVADGQPHKNHINLLKAWEILASQGHFPKLLLTLPERDYELKSQIKQLSEKKGLSIYDIGMVSNKDIIGLYNESKALIFPSTLESFGLPLVEANQCGLPIIASELDYVRDVCEPCQTFDPNSPISIARAVTRFLGYNHLRNRPMSAEQFIQEYL
ncbi:glycosyltransferase [Vibrio salinus]|uniref:glycosyltransferase n=1 Tax=Vibrio salinus TaxID=2899784 RepID=UPI001E392496|nr:glycosyltransferase [Vibrio salinus]MCE0493781.1 glycosyltransferase [Vibrio salinus]